MLNILEILHIAPLAIIAALTSYQYLIPFTKKFQKLKSFDSILLILSSIGIAAGGNVHHISTTHHLIDPCFGYAAILILVSARLFSALKEKNIISNNKGI